MLRTHATVIVLSRYTSSSRGNIRCHQTLQAALGELGFGGGDDGTGDGERGRGIGGSGVGPIAGITGFDGPLGE